jgi:hypothetical protein
MSTPSDPNDPTRADLPPTHGGAGDPTMPMERTAATERTTTAPVADRPLRDEEEDDRNKAWWLWALLALAILAIVLFALLRDDDDDTDDVGTVDDTVETTEVPEEDPAAEDDTIPEDAAEGDAGTDPGADEGDEGATTPAAPAPGSPEADLSDDPGTATTGDGTDLFTLLQGDDGDAERLAPYADTDVLGEGVQVVEVVEGEGFWIGAGDERIFAHGADDLVADVEVGQRIDFDGFLKPNPPADSADVHDIGDEQGAELHRQQGHHIELRSITPVD